MSFDIRSIWALVLRRWLVFAVSAATALALAYLWLLQVTPLYTATTQVLLDPRKKNPLPGEAFVGELQVFDYSAVATEIGLISSYAVANRAAESLRLAESETFTKPVEPSGPWSGIGGLFPHKAAGEAKSEEAAAEGTAAATSDDARRRELASAVQGGTTVRRVGTTYFIDISYTDADPQMAANIANAVADAYLDEQLEARFQASKRAADWLGERIGKLRKDLEASENAVAEHRAQYNLVSPKAGSLSQQQATEINAQLVAARAQTVEKKSLYEQAAKLVDGDLKLEAVAAVMQSPVVAALRQQEAETARQEADLLTRYGPEHPNVVKVRAERRDVKRQMTVEVGRIVANLKSDYDFALGKERSLEASLQELTGAGNRNDQPMIKLRELEREAEANKTLYETLLARFKEAEQQQNLQTAESRVIAPAFVPQSPSYPNGRRVLMFALMMGFGVGFGIAALLEQLESGFTTVEEVESVLQFPVLAMVPRVADSERKLGGHKHSVAELVVHKPLSRFGESIRSARVSAQLSSVDKSPKVILVTSSVPTEGKTTIALALAYSAAGSNQRVLVMDCDLRHPSTSKHFNLADGPGLTDLLSGQKPAEQTIYRSAVERMTVLPSGSTTRHPPDMLGSDRFKQLIKSMREAYDVIIVDAPPVTPVIDSVLLSHVVDKVVFVVQWRTTPRDVAMRALASLHEPRQKVAGIVLNNTELSKLSHYSGYYSYYSKKYDKYYSS